MNEPSTPTVLRRIGQVAGGHWDTRQGPTATQRESLRIARAEFSAVSGELLELIGTQLPLFEAAMEEAGAPWTPGRKLP